MCLSSVVAPDCGLKYLPRNIAFGKMRAMVEGAEMVRQELRGDEASWITNLL